MDHVTSRSPLNRSPSNTSHAVDMDDPSSSDRGREKTKSNLGSVFESISHYLHVAPEFKIGYYALTIIVFSMLKESVDVPHFEALTSRYSVLNQVFVKQGWGITLFVFMAYQIIIACKSYNWKADVKKLFVRSVVTTVIFFLWCAVIFPLVENQTAACTHNGIVQDVGTRKRCRKYGFVYHSFDISGHSYLLIYCVLVMMEESKQLLIGKNGEQFTNKNLSKEKQTSFILQFLDTLSFLLLCSLCLLWDIMLIITTIYYHTFTEKILGSMLAVSMWYLLYKLIFPSMFKNQYFS